MNKQHNFKFLFRRKLSWHTYFSFWGFKKFQNWVFSEKNDIKIILYTAKNTEQNGQFYLSVILKRSCFYNFFHHKLLDNIVRNMRLAKWPKQKSVETLDLVLCILLVRMCFVNITICQLTSEYNVKKAHFCLCSKMAILIFVMRCFDCSEP